jgi:polar amino acid transport system substrate-binding protein
MSRPYSSRMRTCAALAAMGFATASCGMGSSPGAEAGASSGGASRSAVPQDDSLVATLPKAVAEAGVIRVATDPTYPPFESVDSDGKTVVGFDADLARAIGDVLGVQVEFVNTSFDAIIPALDAGTVDLAMSSIGDTKEREEVVDFVTYYWNGTLMLVEKGNPAGIEADMVCEVRVGVIRGSLQQNTFLPEQADACEEAGLEPPVAQAFQNGPQAQLALESGRIDGVMQDAPPVLDAVDKKPDAFEAAGPLVRNPNPGGIAFPDGSELVEPVHAALGKLMADGTYEDILETWNLEPIAIDESQINGALS